MANEKTLDYSQEDLLTEIHMGVSKYFVPDGGKKVVWQQVLMNKSEYDERHEEGYTHMDIAPINTMNIKKKDLISLVGDVKFID